jgi:galactoside O-acetyltransferase
MRLIFDLRFQINIRFRKFYYSNLFKKFGKRSYIYGKIIVYFPENVIFGNNSTLNEGVLINARNKIIIGNKVHISPFSILNTAGLNTNPNDRVHISNEIRIEDNVWIGSNAIINPGIKIGKNSIVGTGAVVTKDVPANVVVVGVPAKIIKKLD